MNEEEMKGINMDFVEFLSDSVDFAYQSINLEISQEASYIFKSLCIDLKYFPALSKGFVCGFFYLIEI